MLTQHRPLDEALEAAGALAALEPRDRAFARLLVATVLRRLPQLDAVLAGFLREPLPERLPDLANLLRTGAAQLLFLGTPAHAAVASAVDLAKQSGLDRYKGLINAVLRRVSREGAAVVAAQDAERLMLPDWLWQSWCAAYGEAATRASARVLLADPPLDLTVPRDAEGWAERLGARLLPTGSLRLESAGAVTELPGFAEGAWWVQDAAAAIPARLLGPIEGRNVIDLCAAPGGKTAQLAAAGARVTAVDRSPKRLRRLAVNLERLGLEAVVQAADAVTWRPDRPADAVLLDAPCSATGTARRHPDVLRLKDGSDLDRLTALQDRLLDAATEMVKPGGLLIYCVCSLMPEEGAARITRLIADRKPLVPEPIAAAEAGDASLVTPEGWLRTLPAHFGEVGGLDGFFAARLRRT